MQDAPTAIQDRRRERSRQTRRRIVDAASRLFAERGYAVPLTEIAAAASVSVQNVYVLFRNKQTLASGVLQLAVLGDDLPIPPHERPWFQELVEAPDARLALGIWVDNTLPIYARVAPLARMFIAEPDLAEIWAHSEELRVDGFRYAMGIVAGKGRLRGGIDLDAATDAMFVLLSPLVYQEFVAGRGWAADRWGRWVADALWRSLFELADARGSQSR